eukprot:768628-Hanusia_phi.AAC.15
MAPSRPVLKLNMYGRMNEEKVCSASLATMTRFLAASFGSLRTILRKICETVAVQCGIKYKERSNCLAASITFFVFYDFERVTIDMCSVTAKTATIYDLTPRFW